MKTLIKIANQQSFLKRHKKKLIGGALAAVALGAGALAMTGNKPKGIDPAVAAGRQAKSQTDALVKHLGARDVDHAIDMLKEKSKNIKNVGAHINRANIAHRAGATATATKHLNRAEKELGVHSSNLSTFNRIMSSNETLKI